MIDNIMFVSQRKIFVFLIVFIGLSFWDGEALSTNQHSFTLSRALTKRAANTKKSLWYKSRHNERKQRPVVHTNSRPLYGMPTSIISSSESIFQLSKSSYFLTRIVFLRALAFVYGVAFLVAKHQNKALIGDNGITPARKVLDKAQERGKQIRERRQKWLSSDVANKPPVIENPNIIASIKNSNIVRQAGMRLNRNPTYQNWRERLWDRHDGMGRPVTTLLWLAKDRKNLNPWLDGIANAGILMSLAVFLLGAANLPLMLGLWLCQRSLMAVGGPWYGYGWEPQLAELGFHALFLVPLWSLNPIEAASPPSKIVIYAIRWYLFKIMMGAGLIKLRSGDFKWMWPQFTTMSYFYETQPVPNPLTRYFHFQPHLWHKFEVLSNHFVELVAPWLLLFPNQSFRRVGGLIQIIFQAVLISSGNLSFLNWLTIVPAISCFDDVYLRKLFSPSWQNMAALATATARIPKARVSISTIFAITVGILNIPVVKNLLSTRQLMNASFDPLRLVNTYGAFGVVDEVREELIVSATTSLDEPWREYEFKVKPGNVSRKPRFISPYHYRLDWQFWIASTMRDINRSPWMYSFLLKLLEQDPDVLGLLDSNPFDSESESPKYIRVDKYRYKFCKPDRSSSEQPFWTRDFVERVLPKEGILTATELKEYVED